jgi:hypothetical protein
MAVVNIEFHGDSAFAGNLSVTTAKNLPIQINKRTSPINRTRNLIISMKGENEATMSPQNYLVLLLVGPLSLSPPCHVFDGRNLCRPPQSNLPKIAAHFVGTYSYTVIQNALVPLLIVYNRAVYIVYIQAKIS